MIIWKTEPTVHYYNVCARTWTAVKFQSNQAAHDYYRKLVTQFHTPTSHVKLVEGTITYHEPA